MKIAVLLYGQPRFFEHTWKNIFDHFSIDGCIVDFFAHFWTDVGFIPADDVTQDYVDTKDIIANILSTINIKKYIHEDYSQLDNFGAAQKTIFNFFIDDFLSVGRDTGQKCAKNNAGSRARYSYGQHLSLYKCFCLMEEYEQRNNCKYDIVIKVRTDHVYPNLTSTQKYNIYIQPLLNETNTFLAKTIKYTNFLDCEDSDGHTYKNTPRKLDCADLNLDTYVISITDIFMCATRDISAHIFRNWLLYYNYFASYYTLTGNGDKINRNSYRRFYRINLIIGDIAMYQKCKIIKFKNLNPWRVVLIPKAKKKWLNTDKHRKTIYIPDLNCDVLKIINSAVATNVDNVDERGHHYNKDALIEYNQEDVQVINLDRGI